MHISHIAIWTTRLEELRNFYITYFNGTSNEKYINPKKGFESYFISFDQGFASLEIMQREDITTPALKDCLGLAHFSFSAELSIFCHDLPPFVTATHALMDLLYSRRIYKLIFVRSKM